MSDAGLSQDAPAPSGGGAAATGSVYDDVGTGSRLIRAADQNHERERMYAQRKRVNQVALALSLGAMVFGVFWLIWILWETVRLGVGGPLGREQLGQGRPRTA